MPDTPAAVITRLAQSAGLMRTGGCTAQRTSSVLDRPAASALCDMQGLMLHVFDQAQVFETIVGFVAVDVVQMHSMRNRTVSGSPNNAMFEVADTGPDVDAHVASIRDGPLAAAPMPVILSSPGVATLATKFPPVRSAVRRVELRARGAARLAGLGLDSAHVGSIGD